MYIGAKANIQITVLQSHTHPSETPSFYGVPGLLDSFKEADDSGPIHTPKQAQWGSSVLRIFDRKSFVKGLRSHSGQARLTTQVS